MPQYVIETTNLSKKYNNTLVVENINMNVEKGKIYGLLGRNGAGKTTTMCMLLGLSKPTSGEIKLFGEDITKNTQIYKKIGSIIETPGFYPNLNAEDNLKIFCKIRGDYKKENIKKVLKLVNLDNEKNKKFKNYSLGMKQRLGLALALVHNPKLLILDEPINGLDPVGIKEIRELIVNLSRKMGITVLISSHILSEIETMADEIGVINNGQLIQELNRKELEEVSKKKAIYKVNNGKKAKTVLLNEKLVEKQDFDVENTTIYLYTNLEKRGYINSILVKNDIEVKELKIHEENLEEYFMRLIGGK